MNTKYLMISTSCFMGLAGLATSFAPDVILLNLRAPTVSPLPVLVQLLGALYLAFAMANWTAKSALIGGIYSRPLALGNSVHFIAGALALLKHQSTYGYLNPLSGVLLIYAIFALIFIYLVFGKGAVCEVNRG